MYGLGSHVSAPTKGFINKSLKTNSEAICLLKADWKLGKGNSVCNARPPHHQELNRKLDGNFSTTKLPFTKRSTCEDHIIQ